MNPYCVTIQMKAIEQYLHVVLFIINSSTWKYCYRLLNELPACVHMWRSDKFQIQYTFIPLLITLSEDVDESVVSDHSKEN